MAVSDVTSLSISKYQLGIQVTKVTDSSSDWASVANDTYFYDKTDNLVHYKNGSGSVLEIFSSSGGLTYFTETGVTTSPNATIPVVGLIATSGATNLDVAIVPKGTGSLMVNIPDNTLIGGNKRGTESIDLQISRNAATQVASGQRSTLLGGWNSIASASYSLANGLQNTASNQSSTALGEYNTASGQWAVALGTSNVSSNNASVALGYINTSSAPGSFSVGDSNTASGSRAVAIGQNNTASGGNSTSIGYGNSNAGGQGCTALGWSNTITVGASYGAFAVGQQNNISGQGFGVGVQNSVVNGYAFGQTNTVSGGVALGVSNTANGSNSFAFGTQSSSFGIRGRYSYAAGQLGTVGDSQTSKFILQIRTTNATPSIMITNYGASITPYSNNQIILQNNNAFRFKGSILAIQSGSTNVAAWDVDGLIVRGANASTTSLVVSNINLVSNNPGWGTPILTADTTYGALQVQAVGAASTNIQWTCSIDTTEVIYA